VNSQMRAEDRLPNGGEFTFRELVWERLEQEADLLLRDLFPICRSLTGEGVRQTLRQLKAVANFEMHEVPSGTKCFDWVVPDEWNVRDAFIADLTGERLVDFRRSNLHLASYSVPFDGVVSFEELDTHLHSLPALPEAIPYRTTYYNRDWGFCLTHRQRETLDRNADYRVVIDATLQPGGLTYGECLLPGTSGEEYLVSSYCCHPSLANDNLSGVILWTLLLRELQSRPHRHAYRFILVPETIGAIAYLSLHKEEMRRVSGGLIPTTVAGPGKFGFKRTYLGDHRIDRVIELTLREQRLDYVAYPFDINGSDETQYSAPFFRIPIGTISKDKYYEYPFYHTSLDNLEFISAGGLIDSLKLYMLTIEKLELDVQYESQNPYSEPMLGKRGLYPPTGGSIKQSAVDPSKSHLDRTYSIGGDNVAYGSELDAIRWVMFTADGSTGLLEVAETSGLPVRQLYDTAENLRRHGLLQRTAGQGR